ncbi:MAG: PA14 domain-containing protein [Desulfomonile sp.]|nr:PA14 domain-containing protein [Deltaproteobacteria bacterium]
MRASILKIIVAAASVIILATALSVFAEDYLVIKKKGGPSQKVPLNFPLDQIESVDVESAPRSTEVQAGRDRPTPESDQQLESSETQPSGRSPDATPRMQPSGPMIMRDRPGAVGDRSYSEDDATAKKPEKPSTTRPPAPPRTAMSPATARTGFTVNIYQLPESVKALPDYSALTPKKTVTSETINLEPARGANDPSGLPENPDGLGMRFMGIFMVTGEGIFKWRLYSKDGVRLHIDDKTLVENDGIHDPSSKTGFLHLAEGTHTIIVDSFNSKGAPTLRLFVQPPSGPEQVFSVMSGLKGWEEPSKPYDVLWGQVYFVPKGDYPRGPDFSRLSPVGRLIASELNISGSEGIPGLPGRTDMVGLRYQGFFNVSGAGIFAFRLLADQSARLTIGTHGIAEVKGAKPDGQGALGWAFLQEGSYPVSVDYFHAQGPPRLELYVTQPQKEEEIFSPARNLTGFSSDSGKMTLIPAFVYFLEPNTRKLPNFNKLTPSGMFYTKAIDYPVDRGSREFPGVPKRTEWLGLRFYVKFSLSEQEAGIYKFRIVCDDTARLIIGKKIVINAEGSGKVLDQSGSAELPAGSHEMFLDYLQATGPNALQLYITPPGGEEKIFAFQ